MKKRNGQVPGLDPVRRFPYYKLQYWDESRAVWIDVQKRFESADVLRDYAASKLVSTCKRRVMIVEDYGRRRIDDSIRV